MFLSGLVQFSLPWWWVLLNILSRRVSVCWCVMAWRITSPGTTPTSPLQSSTVSMTTPPIVTPFGAQPQQPPPPPPQPPAARDVNTASLCRIGQETVQDIVFRTMEIFQLLRNMQVNPTPSLSVLCSDNKPVYYHYIHLFTLDQKHTVANWMKMKIVCLIVN